MEKVFFASNCNFGKIILENLIEGGLKPFVLISSSNPLPIKDFAKKEGIEIKEADNKGEFHQIIEKEQPAIVVVASFGIIISPETLKLSCFINVHPSLLPKYRGSTPIQNVILNNEKETGTTIIQIVQEMDAGPILLQEKITTSGKENYQELEELLAKKSAKLLAENFHSFLLEKLVTKEQNDELATYTRVFTKEDGKINWGEKAEKIERKVRALNPWPGTYTYLQGKQFKILEAEVQEQTKAGPFGELGKLYLGTNNTIAVQTGENFLLISKLQLEGKTPVSSKEFLQGNMSVVGSVFN
jgi:methionyl-tRNA formyltransferase